MNEKSDSESTSQIQTTNPETQEGQGIIHKEIQVEKITPKHDVSWYVKWVATAFYIAAAICAAAAILPYNYIGSLIGATLWTFVGVLWHDRSIMVLNAFTAAMMVTATVNYYAGL